MSHITIINIAINLGSNQIHLLSGIYLLIELIKKTPRK